MPGSICILRVRCGNCLQEVVKIDVYEISRNTSRVVEI